MGSGSERMIESMNEKSDEKVAEYLGISISELSELDYEIEEETSDEGIVYNTYFKFSDNSPKEILEKIGVGEDNRIEVDMNIYNEGDDDEL